MFKRFRWIRALLAFVFFESWCFLLDVQAKKFFGVEYFGAEWIKIFFFTAYTMPVIFISVQVGRGRHYGYGNNDNTRGGKVFNGTAGKDSLLSVGNGSVTVTKKIKKCTLSCDHDCTWGGHIQCMSCRAVFSIDDVMEGEGLCGCGKRLLPNGSGGSFTAIPICEKCYQRELKGSSIYKSNEGGFK